MVAALLARLDLTESKANYEGVHTGGANCFIAELFLHKILSEVVCFDYQILFLSNSVVNQLCML